MEKKVGVEIAGVGTMTTIDSFNNILENRAAQAYLLEMRKIKTLREIFEDVYQTQVEWGEKQRIKRALDRQILASDKKKVEASFLDTPEKEEKYYDKKARDVTAKVMDWLSNCID
jgi:hypothetical protein